MDSERNGWVGRKFLVDVIWPEHTLHVISGSSGTWKTSLLFTLLREFEQSKPVLGYDSHPCPWAYVAFDRDINETWDTLNSIKYDPSGAIYSAYDNWKFQPNVTGVIQSMTRLLPKGGLLIVDGLQMLYNSTETNSYNGIATFVRTLRVAAKAHNVTLIGTCHNAKAKQGEEYAHPRDKIMGSVAWGATVGTVLALDNSKIDTDKTLWICPRTAREYQVTLSRNDHGSIYVRNEDDDTTNYLVLNARLIEIDEGKEFDRAMVLAWALDAKISEATADRWLNQACKKGMLKRIGRGLYRKPMTN